MRRERRKQEVRNRIVEAGLALFDAQGFAATKVSDICRRADVVNKTFFNHFPTKQHLLREIAEHSLETLLADIDQARKRPASTRERLAWFFRRIADNVDAAGPMRRELVTEMIHASHGDATGSEQARQIHEAFASMIEEGRRSGDVDTSHTCEAQTEVVLGTFYALMFGWANVAGYPLRKRAGEAALLLGDALNPSEKGASK